MNNIENILNDYPYPFFVVKPIIENDVCVDFIYKYANNAFGMFLGINHNEMINKKFSDFFDINSAEKDWLDLFKIVSVEKKYKVINQNSPLIEKKLNVEAFHVEPDLCGCIIRDFSLLNHDYFEDLLDKAYTDPLTKLHNRFYLKEKISNIKEKQNIGLAVLDINHLKEINDKKGHQAGDKLICNFVDIMKKHFDYDVLYRIGGDEFIIYICDTTKEKFIKSCEKLEIDLNNISRIGYKFYKKVDSFKHAFQECDFLMYENKQEKRNL